MKPKTVCPYCGSEYAAMSGIEVGGGDYADSISDIWECLDCGQQFSGPDYWLDDDDDDDESEAL